VSVEKILKMGLGPDGKFWLRYDREQGGTCWITSKDLDILTKLAKQGGWTRHFTMGQSVWWGVQYEPTRSRIIRNDSVPQDFVDATDALGEKGMKPTWQTWDKVDFVAFGVDDAWVFGVEGKPVWSKKLEERYPMLVNMLNATLSAKGEVIRKVRNIELSPVDQDMYWIEYYDGQVASHGLPGEWAAKIKEYTASQYHLSNPGEQPDFTNDQVQGCLCCIGFGADLTQCQIL